MVHRTGGQVVRLFESGLEDEGLSQTEVQDVTLFESDTVSLPACCGPVSVCLTYAEDIDAGQHVIMEVRNHDEYPVLGSQENP